MTMVNFNYSPLFRSTVGYDNLAGLFDSVRRLDTKQDNFPPYNIELTGEDTYRISMAVAGFEQSELNVEAKENLLTITGKKHKENADKKYLYHGIAARSFERRFQLADHVKVTNARLENGLLHVELAREIPEAMKPRTIEITSDSGKLLEG
jgi:molecular chaperone IbpA